MIYNPSSGYSIDLRDLFTRCAQVLTGQAVVIRFEPSPSHGALASALVNQAGQPEIWIDPSLPLDACFDLLLHEAVHVRCHAAKLPRIDTATLKSGSIINHARETKDPAYMRGEDEAHRLQHEWRTWAIRNGWRVIDQNMSYAGFPAEVIRLLAIRDFWRG